MSQLNRYARKEKNPELLRAEDIDAALVQRDDSGKTFRFWFGVCVIGITVLLGVLKYDVEERIDLPEHLLKTLRAPGEGEEGGEEGSSSGTASAPTVDENEMDVEKLYQALGVDERLEAKVKTDGEKSVASVKKMKKIVNEDGEEEEVVDEEATRKAYRESAEYKRRLHNFEVKSAIEKSWESHNEEYGQLVVCGAKCEAKHKDMEVAYLTLNSKVDRELYSVFDIDVTKGGKVRRKDSELKKKMKEKKKEIEENTEDGSLERRMELAELQDAYDILVDPKARRYYQMFGVKPPESMKYVDATHGGWGQDLLLRTHKNRLVLAWLDQLGSAWGDYTVLFIIGALGFVIPAMVQLPRIIEMAKEIEAEEIRMKKMQEKSK